MLTTLILFYSVQEPAEALTQEQFTFAQLAAKARDGQGYTETRPFCRYKFFCSQLVSKSLLCSNIHLHAGNEIEPKRQRSSRSSIT